MGLVAAAIIAAAAVPLNRNLIENGQRIIKEMGPATTATTAAMTPASFQNWNPYEDGQQIASEAILATAATPQNWDAKNRGAKDRDGQRVITEMGLVTTASAATSQYCDLPEDGQRVIRKMKLDTGAHQSGSSNPSLVVDGLRPGPRPPINEPQWRHFVSLADLRLGPRGWNTAESKLGIRCACRIRQCRLCASRPVVWSSTLASPLMATPTIPRLPHYLS